MVDIVGVVHGDDLVARRERRLVVIEHEFELGDDQVVLDRVETFGRFRMPVACVVQQAIRMRNKSQHYT